MISCSPSSRIDPQVERAVGAAARCFRSPRSPAGRTAGRHRRAGPSWTPWRSERLLPARRGSSGRGPRRQFAPARCSRRTRGGDQRRGRAGAELQRELLNGCCGRVHRTSSPAARDGFGVILPATLIRIPRSGSFATTYSASSDPPGVQDRIRGRCHTVWRYRPRRRSFPPGAVFRFRSTRSSIPADNPSPGNEELVSAAYCCGGHAPNPEAKRRVRRHPFRQRDASCPSGSRSRSDTDYPTSAAPRSETSRPDGDSAARVVECTSIDGSNARVRIRRSDRPCTSLSTRRGPPTSRLPCSR